jgi:hypothetical protein
MRPTPTTTQVIQFCNSQAFANIPAYRLEAAQEHGLDFHGLAAAYAKQLWIDEIPEDCQDEFRGFTEWYDHVVVPPPVLVEQQLIHPVWGYSGTPDWVGLLRGHNGLVLLDWKPNSGFSAAWVVQVAAYRDLCVANGYPVERVGIVQRRKGRKAKFTECTESLANGFAVFLAGLTWWRYFND